MTERRSGRAAAGTLRQAREAVAREAWAEAYGLLHRLDPRRLTPDDCAAFADAAWWTTHVEESIVQRARAYSGYAAADDARRAAYSAWMLFYEHQLAGRAAVAAGWLRRARRHLRDEPECVEQCYLAWMDTEAAQQRGAFDEAMASARRMAEIARRCDSPDLHAMSVQAQAGVLVARGRVADGLEDDRVRARLAGLGPVVGQHVARMPYPLINTLFDDLVPAGLHHYWKGAFSYGLPDGAVDAFVEYGPTTPSIQSVTVVFPIDGACHRVRPEDTAFSYRDADYSIALSPTLTTREECEARKDWVRAYHKALEPHCAEGAYVNFMDADDQDRVRANYRGNHARLTALKRRYDPGNLFRLNHNITP